jgi:hypothetical protein
MAIELLGKERSVGAEIQVNTFALISLSCSPLDAIFFCYFGLTSLFVSGFCTERRAKDREKDGR